MNSAIRHGTALIFVKRQRKRIVAAATIARFSTPTGTHYRIEDVIVHPDQRGKGLGRKLMQHLLDHLRTLRAGSVELTSRPARVAANALYRALGFTPRETNVYTFRFGCPAGSAAGQPVDAHPERGQLVGEPVGRDG